VEALAAAVSHRQCAAAIGPAGSGKTSLTRFLKSRLPEARFRVHYVKVTDLSKRDLCREIAAVMDVAPAGSYPVLVRRLQKRFLATQDTDGVRPVLLLDDVQDMRPDVLGLLCVLTNFEMDSRLLLSVVLVGQPPLRRLLRREELEDVAGRLSHIVTLRLLSREETSAYVKHRMTIAGARVVPFDEDALTAIFEASRGNMRAIDSVALKALEVAHRAGAKAADANHVVEARKLVSP
jgi:general secretion pathway protein A